ncbi:MAG: hypothetical protein F6J87_24080 [Spirulina sp. SIO3F2]|nr:hypothetical protein [Spirulina sp. SIO3F2]
MARGEDWSLNPQNQMVLDGIAALLRDQIGLNPAALGDRMLTEMIRQTMQTWGYTNLATYWQQLQTSPTTFEALVEAVVVPETYFFRNPESFDYLRYYVLSQPQQRRWRILSVPCSTGEEPYSIALTLMEAGLSAESFYIDAVDISAVALTKAHQGIYRAHAFRQPQTAESSTICDRYFQIHQGQYHLLPAVRSQVRFHHANLADANCLKYCAPYDIVFCRNLLIYLHTTARAQAWQHLERLVRLDGRLFLGYAEINPVDRHRFIPIPQPHTFAYRKLARPTLAHPTLPRTKSPRRPSIAQPPTLPRSPDLPQPEPEPGLSHSIELATSTVEATPLELEEIRDLANQGELTQAAEQCDRYLQAHPTHATAHVLRGEIHQAQGEDEAAQTAFHKALYLAPNCEAALMHLLLWSEQQGDWATAQRLRKRLEALINGEGADAGK